MGGTGTLAIGAAAVLWALGGTVASRVIDRGASVIELTEARAGLSVLGMWAIASLIARDRPRASLSPAVTLIFGASLAAANYFYYASIDRLPVAVAIVVQYTAPALVVLWNAGIERRPPTRRMLAALAATVLGVVLLSDLPSLAARGEVRLDAVGLLFAGISSVAFAGYMIAGERVGGAVGPERGLLRGLVVASLFWIPVQLARGRPDTLLDPEFVPWVIFLAVITTILPFLLFLWGLGRVGSSRAGIVSTLEPLTAALLAWVWLEQTLGGLQIAGAALVVLGIGALQVERPPTPAALAERAGAE